MKEVLLGASGSMAAAAAAAAVDCRGVTEPVPDPAEVVRGARGSVAGRGVLSPTGIMAPPPTDAAAEAAAAATTGGGVNCGRDRPLIAPPPAL